MFTGAEKRPYSRCATTAQNACVPAANATGLSFDNVGYTARHHTFFGLSGNFSLARYFGPILLNGPHGNDLPRNIAACPKDKLTVSQFSMRMMMKRSTCGRRLRACRQPHHPLPTSNNFGRWAIQAYGRNSEIFLLTMAIHIPENWSSRSFAASDAW
jgi:alanyl-tRNA synthetase